MSVLERVRGFLQRLSEKEKIDRLQALEHDIIFFTALENLFSALANKSRLKMLYDLEVENKTFTSLLKSSNKTIGSFGHDRRVLMRAGLMRKDGERYCLTPRGQVIVEVGKLLRLISETERDQFGG